MEPKQMADLLVIIACCTTFWVVIAALCSLWHSKRQRDYEKRAWAADERIASVRVRKLTVEDVVSKYV